MGESGKEALSALMDLSGRWIDAVHQVKPIREIILDLDSSVSKTYGRQEGSAYNGYFRCECYHPLFCFNQFGDLERAFLRNGNVHSAEDWPLVLEPIVARYRNGDIRRFFRGDAAFADPKVYRCLEAERYLYAIRLPSNAVLHRRLSLFSTVPWIVRQTGPSYGITTFFIRRRVGTSRIVWWPRSNGTTENCSLGLASS